MNQELGAQAFTHGSDVYFGAGKSPGNNELTAHELTHVVQQGTAPDIKQQPTNERSNTNIQSKKIHTKMAGQVVQFYPGDGMVPPGDCSWARYKALLVAVESTKKVTATLGRCYDTDDCVTLATKIAAATAEIAARTAMATTCFKGGDKIHRDHIEQTTNMMMRCYRYFDDSNCPQQLVQVMEEVVERTQRLVEAGLTIAAIAALIVAIIALGKAILAVGVAGSIAAGILAVIAALELALKQIQQAH
jgi:hypothetical protein